MKAPQAITFALMIFFLALSAMSLSAGNENGSYICFGFAIFAALLFVLEGGTSKEELDISFLNATMREINWIYQEISELEAGVSIQVQDHRTKRVIATFEEVKAYPPVAIPYVVIGENEYPIVRSMVFPEDNRIILTVNTPEIVGFKWDESKAIPPSVKGGESI